MKKTLVIIAARGIGDLIYHLPLLRSLYESYKEKLIILSNKVNHSKEVYKFETFYKEIIEFENTRFGFFKTLKTIKNLKNIINKCNVDQLILTSNSRRLMTPIYLSGVKEKIIFGQGKFFFIKDNKYQYLTHADKIMKYTEDLNLPIKAKNFYLTQSNLKNIDNFKKKNLIFINVDSHHDQNNWNINLMEDLMVASFNQNPKAMKLLKKTGTTPLTHTQGMGIWKEEFPRILTKIRGSGEIFKMAGSYQEPFKTTNPSFPYGSTNPKFDIVTTS